MSMKRPHGYLGVQDQHVHDVRRGWSTVFMEERTLPKEMLPSVQVHRGCLRHEGDRYAGVKEAITSSDLVSVMGDAIGLLRSLGG